MPERNRTENGPDTNSILAVIVLYKMHPRESPAFKTLEAAISRWEAGRNCIRILLYDNTPGGCDPGPLPEGIRYEAASYNGGLAGAYNWALAIAQSEKCVWLLTLDQDTRLPSDYLERMTRLTHELELDDSIAAIVPRLTDGSRAISPMSIKFWGQQYLPADFTGIGRGEIHALNSASLFRVTALRKIGGFDPYFWLDYVDMNVYHQLYLCGNHVYVAGDIEVEHELSLLHRASLDTDRFRNVLAAESAYCDLYGGWIKGLVLTARLLVRIGLQRRRGDAPALSRVTLDAFKRRLFASRASRIECWRREATQRLPDLAGKDKDGKCSIDRPPISVCMAAYNGERFIGAQIKSILNQLSDNDEVIIVDDGSSDGTCGIIERFHDTRIRLKRHESNEGVLRSFEDAIRLARGDILFLADQDDVWMENKVLTMLEEFRLHPEADVVTSDATPVDEDGSVLGASYYAKRGKFRSGVLTNVLRCKYLGCTMAFRRRICARILPFPADADVLHDLWIGASNSLAGGETLYIARPLVLYRRHGDNTTGSGRLPFTRQIRIRWDLCRLLAGAWLRARHTRDG